MGEGDQTQPHCKDKRDLLTIKQGEDWWTESHKGTKRKGDSGQIAFDKAFAGDRASSGGTDGKESACSARDPGSIPGSGRSPGESNGNPLQYSCLENPMEGGAWWVTVRGVAESGTTERLHFHLQ